MDKHIFKEIRKMKEEGHISFHTPGHKGRNSLIDWRDYLPFADLTEVGDLDNLHDPRGIIKKSQETMARIFGARETLYSINGTTGGLYISMGTLTQPGDRVLIQRNSHKAVYNGCILNRLDIVYLMPRIEEGIQLEVDPDDLEDRLKNDPSIRLVVITSPNYYGVVADMERIVEIVRRYDRYLLVDEAHGSHLCFSASLPKSSVELGADLVVQSTHKSLPSFTQSSMIHVASPRVDLGRLRTYSSLYQSTSPSYLLLLSLELAGHYMEEEGFRALDKNISLIEDWMERCESQPTIDIFTRKDKDPSKILFSIDGYRGPDLERLFREEGIYLEMADPNYALALATVMNSQEDIDLLFGKMLDLAARGGPREDKVFRDFPSKFRRAYPIYEAFYLPGERVDLAEAGGRVAKDFVIPYPPGQPLVVPGEVLEGEVLEEIFKLRDLGLEVLGLDQDGQIEVVREDENRKKTYFNI